MKMIDAMRALYLALGYTQPDAERMAIERLENRLELLMFASRQLVNRDFSFIGSDADTSHPASLYRHVKTVRAALDVIDRDAAAPDRIDVSTFGDADPVHVEVTRLFDAP